MGPALGSRHGFSSTEGLHGLEMPVLAEDPKLNSTSAPGSATPVYIALMRDRIK